MILIKNETEKSYDRESRIPKKIKIFFSIKVIQYMN
jgi:hypothetical protein